MADERPWLIRHIDLSEPLPDLDADATIDGVYLVYWWKDLPLGERILAAGELPVPAPALRSVALDAVTDAVGDRLFEVGFRASLPEYAPQRQEAPDEASLNPIDDAFERARRNVLDQEEAARALAVSVIICTRDRPADLRSCLASFQASIDPPQEIIVVDNAPRSDATREVCADFAETDLPVRYELEARPGLSVARNAGIRAASRDIIMFTDDDVVVHEKWLARLRAGFADPAVGAVTGLVLPSELETKAQQLFQWNHGGYSWSYRALTFDRDFLDRTRWRGSPVWHIGAGASMAFRRHIFEQLGGFDERLGAGASGCSEDSELWYRILANGWACRYEPASVVFHTHRRTLESLERQLHDYMQGHVSALLAQFERERHPGDLLRAAYWLPRYYGGWMLRRAAGSKGGPSLLDAQVRGFLNGFTYYARHRRDAAAPSSHEFTPDSRR